MRYSVKILLLCIAITHAYSDGKVPKSETFQKGARIVQGKDARNGQFPHMTHVTSGCGGSLIDAKWVLTAARCVAMFTQENSTTPSRSLFTYFGNVNLAMTTYIANVSKIYKHPEHNGTLNDISLLELVQSVPFTATIKSIRLPTSQEDLYAGEVATLTGFGVINDNGVNAMTLKYVDLRVISNDECQENSMVDIHEQQICAKGIESPSQGPCRGDIGGGLILSRSDGDILIGIHSFLTGTKCEDPNPSGYTRVTYYLDWIKETTGLDL